MKLECSRLCIFEGRTVLSKVGWFYNNKWMHRMRRVSYMFLNYIAELCVRRLLLVASIIIHNLPSEIKFILRSTFYHVYSSRMATFFVNGTSNITLLKGTESTYFYILLFHGRNADVENTSFEYWPKLAKVERDK